jgi:hypothetical protein
VLGKALHTVLVGRCRDAKLSEIRGGTMLFQNGAYQIDTMDQPVGRKINAKACQYVKSPCRSRPDTGFECPLISHDKRNNVCETCHFLLHNKVRIERDIYQIADMINNNQIVLIDVNEPCLPKYTGPKKRKYKTPPATGKCTWPGCEAKLQRGVYCHRHTNIVTGRTWTWHKHHGEYSAPPPEFLYRPVEGKKRKPKEQWAVITMAQ